MRSYAEEEKYGLKIAEIVKSRDMEALKKEFPSAKRLVAYSNGVLPYPYKKDSVLAMLAKRADRVFFNEIFNQYFSDDIHKSQALDFLQGTDSLGRKINYHYFADSFSGSEKKSAKIFYAKNADERSYLIQQRAMRSINSQTREQIEAVNFYYSLRDKYTKLGGYMTPSSLNKVKIDKDDNVCEHISGDGFTWIRKFNKLPRLELKYLPQDFDCDSYVASVENLDLNKPFAKQIFEKLDFPDLFYSSCYSHVINKLEDAFRQARDTRISSDLIKFSAVIGNTMVVENDYNKEYGFEKNYYAICRYSERKIHYNAKLIENEDKNVYATILHEITHGLDFKNKTFSITNNIVFPALVFMAAEKDFGVKQDEKLSKILHQAMTYDDVYWSLETLPRLMSEDFGKDKLGENCVKLTSLLNQFANKGYKALIKRFHLHSDESGALYRDFSDEYLVSRAEIEKKQPEDINLRKLLSQNTFGKLRYHLITKYNKFNMATIREDLSARVEYVYCKLQSFNSAFENSEELKKLDINEGLYKVESKLVDNGQLLEEFYYNQAVKTREFFNDKGKFIPQKFFNELNIQNAKAGTQAKPKEKLREIVKVYILINETYRSLGMKPNKSIDLKKMKVPFDNEKVLYSHIKLINRNIKGVYADLSHRVDGNQAAALAARKRSAR